jgi:hypothetical protein
MQEFSSMLSESTIKLDSLETNMRNSSAQIKSPPAILPHLETDFGFLSPPISPAMYSPPPINSTTTKQQNYIGKVEDFNNFLDSGYGLYDSDHWNSPESMHSEELFPDLTF